MSKPLVERLKALTYKTEGCWFFLGNVTPNGYGRIYIGPNRNDYGSVHRVVLELKLGRKLLPGMDAAHSCDIRNCVNPDHIFEATRKENSLDALSKGMWWSAPWNVQKETVHG